MLLRAGNRSNRTLLK